MCSDSPYHLNKLTLNKQGGGGERGIRPQAGSSLCCAETGNNLALESVNIDERVESETII